MTDSRKISVRLKQEDSERLQEYCVQKEQNISRVVRHALDALLVQELNSGAAGTPPRRLSPPEQIGRLVPKYLAWGRGDLRQELNKLYAEVLAASFACKKLYPRTPSVLNGYKGLVQLCPLFGLDEECPTK